MPRREGAIVRGRPRVAILRSSRFLPAAVAATRARWPEADVRVLHQPGVAGELTVAGLSPEAGRCCAAGPLRLWTLVRQHAFWDLLIWRPDEVVVQWWSPAGDGHATVDRVALVLQPRRLHAVLADGTWITVTGASRLLRFMRRVGCGAVITAALVLAAAACWPAMWWYRRCERQRLAGTAR